MILALIPLRVFLGVTFVYAGVDKIIDPTFLQASGPGSIGAQMEAFTRVSPLAPLIQVVGLTFPVQLGLLIAVTEIAVGLGSAERPPVPSGCGRRPRPVPDVLADGVVGDQAVLLRPGPAVRDRLADPGTRRDRRPVQRRVVDRAVERGRSDR